MCSTSYSLSTSITTAARHLSNRLRVEFGHSIQDFAHQLVLRYLDFLDTTPLGDALSDCEALLQSSASLCNRLKEQGQSDAYAMAHELHKLICEDLGVLEDTWHFLAQGRAALQTAYNTNRLLCLKQTELQ